MISLAITYRLTLQGHIVVSEAKERLDIGIFHGSSPQNVVECMTPQGGSNAVHHIMSHVPYWIPFVYVCVFKAPPGTVFIQPRFKSVLGGLVNVNGLTMIVEKY